MIQGLCLIWCVFGFIYRMRNKRKAGKSREAGKQKSREKHNNWKSRKARKNRKAEKQRGKETEKQKSRKSKRQRSKEAEKQRAEKQDNPENQRSRPAGKRGEAKKKGKAEKLKSRKAESKEAGNQKLKKHGKNKLKKIAIPLENPGLICCDDSTWPRCPVLGDTWWDASSSWQTHKRNYTLHVPALWTYLAIYKNLHTCPADLPPLHIHMRCYSFWGGQGARRSEVKIRVFRTVNLGSRLHRIITSKNCWLWLLKWVCHSMSENSAPLNPMVLLIIIPIKWLFHWEYTQHFQTDPNHQQNYELAIQSETKGGPRSSLDAFWICFRQPHGGQEIFRWQRKVEKVVVIFASCSRSQKTATSGSYCTSFDWMLIDGIYPLFLLLCNCCHNCCTGRPL